MKSKEAILGNEIHKNIEYFIKSKNLSKTEFAQQINKTPHALNKVMYDLKKGNVSLKNLVIISDGLGVGTEELFKSGSYEKALNVTLDHEYIQKLIDKVTLGTEFELKELLNDHWKFIDKGERIRLGKIFLEHVKSQEIYQHIKFEGIKTNRHVLYKRI